MPVRFLIFMFLAIGLASCGAAVQKTASTGRVQQPISVGASTDETTEPSLTEDRASVASLPAPANSVEPSFSDQERDPSRLLDLGRTDLSSILGKPAFIRRDMSAEVWQYRTEACVLDLFLYELGQDLAVTYYEFRPRNNGDLVPDECFVRLLQRGVSRAAHS